MVFNPNDIDSSADSSTSDGSSSDDSSGNSGYNAQGGQIKDSNVGTDISGSTPNRGISMPSNMDPDDFPYYSKARPYAVIVEIEGDYDFRTDADVTAVEMVREWYTAPWQYADREPSEWKRVWWSEHSFRRTEHIVEDQSHTDLREVLSEDPRLADKLITECSKSYSNPEHKGPSDRRDCPVCGQSIHLVHDEYEEVENKPVCPDHSIEEVIGAGFLQD